MSTGCTCRFEAIDDPLIGRRVEVRSVDHERSNPRVAIANLLELHPVELRVGESELDKGRQLS